MRATFLVAFSVAFRPPPSVRSRCQDRRIPSLHSFQQFLFEAVAVSIIKQYTRHNGLVAASTCGYQNFHPFFWPSRRWAKLFDVGGISQATFFCGVRRCSGESVVPGNLVFGQLFILQVSEDNLGWFRVVLPGRFHPKRRREAPIESDIS